MNTNDIALIESFGNKVDGYIQAVAEKAGAGVEHFWPIFVQQQLIEGIAFSIFMVCFLLVNLYLIFSPNIKLERFKKNQYNNTIPTYKGVMLIIGSILFLPWVMALCMNTQLLTQCLNPEYAAIQDVIQLMRIR